MTMKDRTDKDCCTEKDILRLLWMIKLVHVPSTQSLGRGKGRDNSPDHTRVAARMNTG